MSTRRIKRIGLSKCIVERLSKHHFVTCQDVLSRSDLELLKLLGLSIYAVKDIVLAASRGAAPKPVTALDLLRRPGKPHPAYLPTSLLDLDKVLHGGVPTGTIAEIAGPSGCGKTQFSLMLSVQATLPPESGGLGGAVAYIDTESAFSAERLVEIAQNRHPDIYQSEESLQRLTRQVHVYSESTCQSLLARLEKLEEDIISKKIRLIIVDSIASLVRKEFDTRTSRSIVERTNLLAKEASLLKYMAETFDIPVVVTNQITTRFGRTPGASVEEKHTEPNRDDTEGSVEVHLEGEGGYVTAALGNTWSHSVNTRLILQYMGGHKRQVLVAKSPVAPFANFIYTIQAAGIVLEEKGAAHYDGTDPGLQHIRVRTSLPNSLLQI